MEGYYQTNQLPPQQLDGQLPHPPDEQPPTHISHNVLAMSMQDHTLPPELQQQLQQSRQAMSNPMISGQAVMPDGHMDDVMRDGHHDIQRRRSMPQAYGNTLGPASQGNPPRRMSTIGPRDMMTFDAGPAGFGNYQFDPEMPTSFSAMGASMGMQDPMGGYVSDAGNFPAMPQDLIGTMMQSQFANMDMDGLTAEPSAMDLFPGTSGQASDLAATSIAGQMDASQLASGGDGYALTGAGAGASLGGRSNGGHKGMALGHDEDMMNAPPPQFPTMTAGPSHLAMESDMVAFEPNMPSPLPGSVPALSTQQSTASMEMAQPSSASATPVPVANSSDQPKEKTIYSKSGFDMLKALWLVATRKNPKIHLGAVDMSCAFVVCDVTMNDCPIIYVSDNFQNLTGYSRHEIMGQNCRFLQAPDGKVEAGSKREFVDDGAVYNLKRMIQEGREVQQSLINYRKGGKPFLNLLTMIPIPWDTDEIRYFIGFQIDLVECPDAISGQEMGGVKVNYKHSDIGQYIWTPPVSNQLEADNGQTLGVDDVSTLLQQFNPNGLVSDWHRQSWDKMLLENTDDVVHVISLKGLFLYLSPSCKRVLEYDAADLVGNPLSSVCHPSDIVPVTRELKDATTGSQVNIVFRIRRKQSGYTWFESHGSLFVDQGRGRKCIILVGRKRPVFALGRHTLEANGGIGDSELWSKLSTSGMFLSVSANIRSLLDLQPESLVGTSIQELMRKESRAEFGRTIEKARKGKISTCKHEMLNRRGQGLQAQTILYPGDASEGQKPSFVLAQTKLLKASSRHAPSTLTAANASYAANSLRADGQHQGAGHGGPILQPAGGTLVPGSQDAALASDDNIFDELRTTKCSSWQFELRQMEKINRILAEELGGLLSNKKKRKRRKGVGNVARDCANCHTRNTPEWRRGPSGQRDLCNSCGLRWAKQTGRVSPRNSTRGSHSVNTDTYTKKSTSPIHSSPLHRSETPNPIHSNGENFLDPKQLASKIAVATGGTGSMAGPHASSTMPPPSQSSLAPGAVSSGMTSIREERESSQT
ncbi:blue light regulator 1 [Trichoderma reesei QM6a]|uniref:Blue light regulator 1 n=3 Tax=Hypocrea jecorina TaxID=51453 RepID=G0RKG6_HYPJQ|nr:blue light regulator 1 [Trichoderma reesei QM6a]AAV80185.1 white collar 1 [Trichoderma reesei]EGR48341.1 blue light regulator 1 [Trichoderma reesei QM6a]ETS06882.1 white collar 1 [Trichoderma reesei RUT C-30]